MAFPLASAVRGKRLNIAAVPPTWSLEFVGTCLPGMEIILSFKTFFFQFSHEQLKQFSRVR